VLTRDDLIDLLVAGLAKAGPAAVAASGARPAISAPDRGPAGRLFLSEHEIKKRLTPNGNRLTIPKNSIVSPLALEWLALRGIDIIRE
jgi:hypothetical protein